MVVEIFYVYFFIIWNILEGKGYFEVVFGYVIYWLRIVVVDFEVNYVLFIFDFYIFYWFFVNGNEFVVNG